ncbi:MAG: peptidoglycan-binding LysM [Pseudomonadota bacterium]
MPVKTDPARSLWLAGPLAPATAALAAVVLGGCSWMPHFHHEEVAPPVVHAAAPRASEAAEASEPQTVTSNLPDVADGSADAPATAAQAPMQPTVVMPDAGTALASSAPKSYVVKKGDTLWGLANLFLKDPWLWPEIWYVNPEVTNPHRIYPGDTLRLALSGDGRQQLQLDHTGAPGAAVEVGTPSGPVTVLHPLLRNGPPSTPIEVLPRAAIASFLSRPSLLSAGQVDGAPYVLSLRDNHMVAGAGQDVYLSKLGAGEGARYDILHVGQMLKAPHVGKVGYLAQYAGTVEVTRAGDPARGKLTETEREVLKGDVLIPADANNTPEVVPHVPAHAVDGRILAVVNGVLLAGQFQVVAISGGTVEGIEPGHVLRIDEAAQRVHDRCATIEGSGTCMHFGDTALPLESAGTMLVFRSFDHMSYALIASEDVPLHVGDHVVRP